MSLLEDIELNLFLVIAAVGKARSLQLEHHLVAASDRHQLVVRAELDHLATVQNADTVRMSHGGEAV